jgi:hypothetical protein
VNKFKYLFLLITIKLLISFNISAQTIFEGCILDKNTKIPLSYATIIFKNNHIGTISNNDGRFKVIIKKKLLSDTIQFSYIGYINKNISCSGMKKNDTIYLTRDVLNIKEVIVIAKDNDYIYKVLYKVIKKYRTLNKIRQSKLYVSLESTENNVPLENVEAFYNSKLSLKNGLIELNLKNGRFGQNKNFQFYSLNTTDILSDFDIFSRKKSQILPFNPGNLSCKKLKKIYNLKFEFCSECTNNNVLISFIPKYNDEKYFSGKILLNIENLTVYSIKLLIKNSKTNIFKPINKNHVVNLKNVVLTISYNPVYPTEIQHILFNYTIDYKTTNWKTINTKSLFLFYDYNTLFNTPYFTKNIKFQNDYERMFAHSFSNDFWKVNCKLPQNIETINAYNYFKTKGYLINFDNNITDSLKKSLNFPIKFWNNKNRILWKDLNFNSSDFNIDESDITNVHAKKTISDFYNIDVLFYLDMFIDINGNTKYITKTIFNTNNSYYFLKHDSNTLTYINLVFDIYEIQKQKMDSLLKNVKNYNKAKDICNNQFEIAKNIVRNLTQETNRGNNISNLVKWNEKINKIIEIDNLLLLSNKSEKAFRVNHNIQNKLPNYYNIGTAYINIKQYEKAIYFLTRSLKNVENNNEKLKDILYNRAIAYLELDNKEKACADLIKASALGDIKSQELLKEINNNPH